MAVRGITGLLGALIPALDSQIQQKLDTTANTSPQPQTFTAAPDLLSILASPTVVGGNIRQSDSFFTGGTESFYSNAAGTSISDKSFENLLIHYYNTNGSNGLWVKRISASNWQAHQYDLSPVTELTAPQYNKNKAFYEKGGGAMRDGNGDLVLDGSSNVIFVNYEDTLALDIIPPPELNPDLTDIPA